MGLILGLTIGLLTGAILGIGLSLPVGSAIGIFIDRAFSGWSIQIELVLILLTVFFIFKFVNVGWKRS